MSYRTANLQMLHFIYYSTNIRTEYFKHAAHSPFFFSSKCRLFHNATLFGSCVIHILYTGCAKIKKKKSDAKGLIYYTCLSKVIGPTSQKSDTLRTVGPTQFPARCIMLFFYGEKQKRPEVRQAPRLTPSGPIPVLHPYVFMAWTGTIIVAPCRLVCG